MSEIKNSQLGQSQSIKLGTKALYDMDAIAYFVCDQPFLSCDSILKLKNNVQEDRIVVPVCEDNSYSPCIFSKKYFDLLLTLEGDKGGKSIIKNNTDYVNYIYFTDKKEFFDIDNLDDLISL
ncbi:MAG: NTP transferase domain-containing protein [Lachnospirales bacterium]